MKLGKVVGEILRQRVSDERGERLAASEHDQKVAADAVGIAVDGEVGEMHLGRTRLVDWHRGHQDAPESWRPGSTTEERRAGKECGRTCRVSGPRSQSKNKNT